MENSAQQFVFTDNELREKEEDLLRLFKKTILEYQKARRQKWKNGGKLWPLESSKLKNQINFKHHKISIVVNDDRTGSIVVWGKQKKARGERNFKNLRIFFALDTDKLVLKAEMFMQYPLAGCSLIKDIFRRVEIKTKEDYRLLVSSFESLIISYI